MDSPSRLDTVEKALGYRFRDAALVDQALTHASRRGAQANTGLRRRDANERLEFLGDALLGGALCLLLYQRLPAADEGLLSQIKSRLASRHHLARAMEKTGLLPLCAVGMQMGSVWPDSVKANLCEALLAAIFLDGGWEPLRHAVALLLEEGIADPQSATKDARMRLQVWCLEHHKRLPDYHSERSGGTHHQPEFLATASIAGQTAAGRSGSRRRAEAAAAAALLTLLEQVAASAAGEAPPPPDLPAPGVR